jgi:hypothetical protein
MILAAIVELILCVRAEQRSLEDIATPLTAIQRDRRLRVRGSRAERRTDKNQDLARAAQVALRDVSRTPPTGRAARVGPTPRSGPLCPAYYLLVGLPGGDCGVLRGGELSRKWFEVCSRIVRGNARHGLDDMQQLTVTTRPTIDGDLPGQRLDKKEEEEVWA